MIRIGHVSVHVKDQEQALKFYTEKVGFVKKHDVSAGAYRWLTVTAPGTEGPEVVLEPMAFPPTAAYQQALYEAGIPATQFMVDDLAREHARMKALGVAFKSDPMDVGPAVIAAFDDTCGNWIQLAQLKR